MVKFIFPYLFRERRNTKKGNKKEKQVIMDVTHYQIKQSDTKLVVINGSCVQLSVSGVTFPHQKVYCKLWEGGGVQ